MRRRRGGKFAVSGERRKGGEKALGLDKRLTKRRRAISDTMSPRIGAHVGSDVGACEGCWPVRSARGDLDRKYSFHRRFLRVNSLFFKF